MRVLHGAEPVDGDDVDGLTEDSHQVLDAFEWAMPLEQCEYVLHSTILYAESQRFPMLRARLLCG